MSIPKSRLLDLLKLQCRIFSTSYNPEGLRTGNRILRQRLKGPAVAAYYPRRLVTLKDLKNAYPDFETWDDDEEDRLEGIIVRKAAGKGAPKKKKSYEESKKFAKKGRKAQLSAPQTTS